MKEAAAIAQAGMMPAKVIRPGVHEADAVAEIPSILAHGAKWKPRKGDREYLHVLLAANGNLPHYLGR